MKAIKPSLQLTKKNALSRSLPVTDTFFFFLLLVRIRHCNDVASARENMSNLFHLICFIQQTHSSEYPCLMLANTIHQNKNKKLIKIKKTKAQACACAFCLLRMIILNWFASHSVPKPLFILAMVCA